MARINTVLLYDKQQIEDMTLFEAYNTVMYLMNISKYVSDRSLIVDMTAKEKLFVQKCDMTVSMIKDVHKIYE